MDDFGTGIPRCHICKRFPFDKIKIDQSFVAKIGRMLRLARSSRYRGVGRALELPVIAEGPRPKSNSLPGEGRCKRGSRVFDRTATADRAITGKSWRNSLALPKWRRWRVSEQIVFVGFEGHDSIGCISIEALRTGAAPLQHRPTIPPRMRITGKTHGGLGTDS